MEADIAIVAALIGDPARAKMLLALMDGLALPAGELAMRANISPQTASSHLSKLLEGNLLRAEAQGRHRYYRLAGPEIGSVIEALLATLPSKPRWLARHEFERNNPLKFARTCYSHLAGTLAVEVTDELQKRNMLVACLSRKYRVTRDGRRWFLEFGIDLDELNSSSKAFARQCLDWSERRHHLAGILGSAFLRRLLDLKWVARVDATRAVRVTHKGQDRLNKLFGLEFYV